MKKKSPPPFRCGFVALVGPTNSGKSTLMNHLLGQKVSIVSEKPQTTLRVVRGILNHPNSQVIFVDTPGRTKRREQISSLLNRSMEKNARDCDIVAWVLDVSKVRVMEHFRELKPIMATLKSAKQSICLLNKIDKIDKLKLLPMIDEMARAAVFSQVIPLSAKTGDGAKDFMHILHQMMPEGPRLYSDKQITDRSEDFQISEIVREKVYRATGEEVPYSTWIEVEHWDRKTKTPHVHVVIHVETSSQKQIMIGKKGQKLKEIGTKARQDIEKLLGYHVCLKLFVDCHKAWKKDTRHLNRYLEVH